jgi:hypothetical protein
LSRYGEDDIKEEQEVAEWGVGVMLRGRADAEVLWRNTSIFMF